MNKCNINQYNTNPQVNTYLYDEVNEVFRVALLAKTNDQNQYHCTNGPAILFEDGTKLFYINGITYRKRIYWKIVKSEELKAFI